METPGHWLEKALNDLCGKAETGLDLDKEIISGLVSYCDLAQPLDAKEYLDNIIGQEVGRSVTDEYLRLRGYSYQSSGASAATASKLHAYVKPPSDFNPLGGTKKPPKPLKEGASSSHQAEPKRDHGSGHQGNKGPAGTGETRSINKGNNSKKKKGGKVISLAEAAKGSIVFQQGNPCSCQARRHRLVSNCLSCGKIVCEQEGEGPCKFCGSLVLKEGSTYAGLEEGFAPLSDAEAAAEAYAKRLVDYDRNSAARTTVIDDQSDYYEIEGNSWLSSEEKELLTKKREEIEEAERAKRNKVVMTFDLVGRKVLLNEDEVSELQSGTRILRPPEERKANRIKPNPTLRVQPIFVDPGPSKKAGDATKQVSKRSKNGLCLEITGRVQRDSNELKYFMTESQPEMASNGNSRHKAPANENFCGEEDECSLDYD